MTTITMTTREAELFRDFILHYREFAIIRDSGALAMNFGTATLGFQRGVLQTVTLNQVVYHA